MVIAVCIDDNNGMLFNRRRQSRDAMLLADLTALAGKGCLWVNGYSAKLFSDPPANLRIAEDFLEKAAPEDICFLENNDISPYAQKVERVILYRWNRVYPADTWFPVDTFSHRWQLQETVDFSGTSHETITREVYAL